MSRERERESQTATETKKRDDHTVWGSSLMLRQTEQTFGVTMSIILFCVSETIIFTGMFERQ